MWDLISNNNQIKKVLKALYRLDKKLETYIII